MEILVTIIHVLASLILIVAVLLQAGRGGGMGAALGGATAQVFGGRGAGNFLTRVTSTCAIIFMFTSLGLSWASSRQRSVLETVKGKETPGAASPAAESPSPTVEPAAQPDAGTAPAAPTPEGAAEPAKEPAPQGTATP